MLYTQNMQRIDVYVHSDIGGGQRGNQEKEADEASTQEEVKEKKSKISSRRALMYVTQTFSAAKQSANLWINYTIGGMGYKTGDQTQQEAAQRSFEIFNDVAGIASSFGMGALYGARGGLVGAIIGSVTMGAATATSTVVKYLNRERELDIKTFKENNSISYLRARSSINMTTGRLR